MEGTSIEVLTAELEEKFPQHKGNITVKEPNPPQLSDTEMAAQDRSDDSDE